jgi:hypothetical protein
LSLVLPLVTSAVLFMVLSLVFMYGFIMEVKQNFVSDLKLKPNTQCTC